MSEKDEYCRIVSVKRCPNCGGKLDKGYFTAPRGMYWNTEKHGLDTAVLDYMTPRIFSFFMLENAPALKCKRCGVAIIDTRRIGETPRSFLKKCVQCGKEIPIASDYCSLCGAEQKKRTE